MVRHFIDACLSGKAYTTLQNIQTSGMIAIHEVEFLMKDFCRYSGKPNNKPSPTAVYSSIYRYTPIPKDTGIVYIYRWVYHITVYLPRMCGFFDFKNSEFHPPETGVSYGFVKK
jgi:hypothetical protein